MPPLTTNQLQILADGSPVEQISGVVEMAWDPKPGEKGPSQGFVLKDATGEVRCYLYGKADGSDFSPVKKGDKVELSAYKGQRGWAGLTKGTIGGEGRAAGSPKLNIYGASRVRNLSAGAPEAQAGGVYGAFVAPPPAAPTQSWPAAFAQPGEAQARPAPSQPGALTDKDLREAWLRNFRALAGAFAGTGSDATYLRLPPEVFAALSAAASMVCTGITDGKIAVHQDSEEDLPW